MSSYHSSFSYLNKNSKNDFGWMIVAFEPDNGEMDSYLSQEQIYTDSYRGTKRLLYGTKYDAVANIKISVVKCNGEDFSVADGRNAYRWLTGRPQASWLNVYVGDEIQYAFLGTVQNVSPYKLDARTVGLTIYFESVSPWAYSPLQTYDCNFEQVLGVSDGVLYNTDSSELHVDVNGVLYNTAEILNINNGVANIDNSVVITINNETDDLYTPIYPNVRFKNNNSDYLSITNATTGEETIITNMAVNEIITLSAEQFIISNVSNKIFGNTFNFVWPRLIPGVNKFIINGSGSGSLEFTYRHPMKIGDCIMDIASYVENQDCRCVDV